MKQSKKCYSLEFALYHYIVFHAKRTEIRVDIFRVNKERVCLQFALLNGSEIEFYNHFNDLTKNILSLPELYDSDREKVYQNYPQMKKQIVPVPLIVWQNLGQGPQGIGQTVLPDPHQPNKNERLKKTYSTEITLNRRKIEVIHQESLQDKDLFKFMIGHEWY